MSDRETLEKVQRRAVNMVTTLPTEMGYSEKLELLGLTTLVERKVRGNIIQMFCCIGGHDMH